jgi:outer membrane protein
MRAIAALLLLVGTAAWCQEPPSTPSRPWSSPNTGTPRKRQSADKTPIDRDHIYTLPELVDLAEEYNPDTRAAWEAAKIRGRNLRIAESELLPSLAAVASADTSRQKILFGDVFVRQTVSLFSPYLTVNYTILDFGARASRIAEARDQLLAANFAFNSVNLGIVFETSRRYYHLLNALGQQTAAQVNLQNADTLEKAIDARMNAGLATITDELEAKSAAAEAKFQLEAAIGQVDIARGDLLTILGARPLDELQVQALSDIQVPLKIEEAPEAAIESALAQRPELLQKAAEERAVAQNIRGARSAYFPTLSFSGLGGELRTYGQQDQLAGVYQGPSETWNASLTLKWNIFDGGRREAELARSRDEARQAQANTKRTEDDVEQQVWTAYIELRTAFRQRDAAIALLTASQSAYDSSVKSYNLGLRSVVDVVTAQRNLAEALSQDVTAKTEVLIQLANLSYRTGDLLKQAQLRSTP